MTVRQALCTTLVVLTGLAQPALAVQAVGRPVGTRVGAVLSNVVGIDLPVLVGGALPTSLGGIAAIGALSLVVGIQLIRRRRK